MRKITKLERKTFMPIQRQRVAAYARVSSGKDAQLHSLSAQISYYNHYIGSRGDWRLIGIYADEALTGTKEDRPEFLRLLNDCRMGKIDLIITKSLTRLARNTVTLLETVRELKALGIDIFFEKENIHTLSTDGELMLTLLASFAQEESRSASENMKWRIRKKFEQGRPTYVRMLGYFMQNDTFYVIPEEAEIVRQIFRDYLSGMGMNALARKLNRMKVPTLHGGPWRENTIYGILGNEKYAGDLMLQKTYRKDHITKKGMVNRGELPMYYVENAHEAIVDKDTFNQVQAERKRRAVKYTPVPPHSSEYPFTGMLRCGLCGKRFQRKLTSSGKKYPKKAVWICEGFHRLGRDFCPSQRIPESILTDKTAEMLGVDSFDRETLQKQIRKIQVPGHNRLIFLFQDGHEEEVTWQNPSRRESWTKEMKQKAREKQLEFLERRRKK